MENYFETQTLPASGKTGSTNNVPLVSIIIPAFNEAAIMEKSIGIFCKYLSTLENNYRWELLLIDDGSTDETGKLADVIATCNNKIKVYHHLVNMNLGNALKTGFQHSKGDYVITMDLDMSYAPEHIEKMLAVLIENQADVVIASPYMKGGKVTGVPFLRKKLSKFVNKYMSVTSQDKFYTFTSMVRAYNGQYLRSLNLKAKDYEINPEIIYKSMILRARIIEIPAHLDWTFQNSYGQKRTSSIRVFKGIFSGLMSGFIFRPYIFFLGLGIIIMLISLYIIVWILINTMTIYPDITAANGYFDDRLSAAIAQVFKARPQAFLIGGGTFIVALQFLSIGFLSLQNKRYFEETFHINTTLYKHIQKLEKDVEKANSSTQSQ